MTSLHVAAVGGSGGAGAFAFPATARPPGGGGAIVTANVPVTGGLTYSLDVGGNGGAGVTSTSNEDGGGGGGGATDIRLSPGALGLSTRLLVAAGGGGAGANWWWPSTGGDAGQAGGGGSVNGVDPTAGGQAGSSNAGGNGGCNPDFCGARGTFGAGGRGGLDPFLGVPAGGAGGFNGGATTGEGIESGGGGGGGWYGGGGGATNAHRAPGSSIGGGGGGSNLVPPGGTVSIDRTAAPSITISYAKIATTTTLTLTQKTGIIPGVTPVLMTATLSPANASGSVQFQALVGTPSSYSVVPISLRYEWPVVVGQSSTAWPLPSGTFAVRARFTGAATSAFSRSFSAPVYVTLI